MVQYFKRPICSQCEKPVDGLVWQIKASYLVVKKDDKTFVHNEWDALQLKYHYLHDKCYDEYFGDE